MWRIATISRVGRHVVTRSINKARRTPVPQAVYQCSHRSCSYLSQKGGRPNSRWACSVLPRERRPQWS